MVSQVSGGTFPSSNLYSLPLTSDQGDCGALDLIKCVEVDGYVGIFGCFEPVVAVFDINWVVDAAAIPEGSHIHTHKRAIKLLCKPMSKVCCCVVVIAGISKVVGQLVLKPAGNKYWIRTIESRPFNCK